MEKPVQCDGLHTDRGVFRLSVSVLSAWKDRRNVGQAGLNSILSQTRALANLRFAIDNPTALETINFSGTSPVICQISRLEVHAENSPRNR